MRRRRGQADALPGLSGPFRHDGPGAGTCVRRDLGNRRSPWSGFTDMPVLRNLTAAYELICARRADPRASAVRHRHSDGRQPRGCGERGGRLSPRRSARCCISARTSTCAQPRVLLVAPLSGHFATLLRNTVSTMLPEHDVYITDWHNARDVAAASSGTFGFDDYVDHIIRFLEVDRPGRPRDRGVPAVRRRAGRSGRDGGRPAIRRSRAA